MNIDMLCKHMHAHACTRWLQVTNNHQLVDNMVRKQYAVTCVQLASWIQVNLSGQVLHIIWTQLCRKLCCEPGGAWSDDSLI